MSRPVKLSELPADVQRKVAPEISGREKKRRAVAKKDRKAKADEIRAQFRLLCRDAGLPMPEPEFYFARESLGRMWRFDYAWSEEKVALEVDGGLFVHGGHNRGAFILQTHEKQNTAASMGWRILHCVPKTLTKPETLELVRKTLGAA